jgi:dTDP-4-amino-4,6-dideoxygalactose transaminase
VTRPVEFFRHTLGTAELASVQETLSSLFLTLGPRVAEFERRLADYLEVEHIVGLSSCSMGLILALKVAGVGPGDEVVTTPMTFVATANAIVHVGATPVFADIDPATGLLDPKQVQAALTSRTRAIIPVGLYGQLADLQALRSLADRYGLVLIDDAAHSLEARRDGIRTAQLSEVTAFSFYATKTLTSGDGGALAVHDTAFADELRRLRNHGITKDAASRYGQRYRHWDMVGLGYKAAMTDIEAALLLPQIERLEPQRLKRAALVERYEQQLRGLSDVQLVMHSGECSHHLFAVLVPAELRDAVLDGLGRRSIGCAVNYRSIHQLSYYRDRYKCSDSRLPAATDFGARTLSLPLWPDLPLDDVNVVVDALGEALEEAKRAEPQAGGEPA